VRVYTKLDNFRKQEFAKLTVEQRIRLRTSANEPQRRPITLVRIKALQKPFPDEAADMPDFLGRGRP
jgi:hypothetical protein